MALHPENRCSRAKQVAQKGLLSGEIPEKYTSGAEAGVDCIGLVPGINPRPTARMKFFRKL
jgi:hypothetical protein